MSFLSTDSSGTPTQFSFAVVREFVGRSESTSLDGPSSSRFGPWPCSSPSPFSPPTFERSPAAVEFCDFARPSRTAPPPRIRSDTGVRRAASASPSRRFGDDGETRREAFDRERRSDQL